MALRLRQRRLRSPPLAQAQGDCDGVTPTRPARPAADFDVAFRGAQPLAHVTLEHAIGKKIDLIVNFTELLAIPLMTDRVCAEWPSRLSAPVATFRIPGDLVSWISVRALTKLLWFTVEVPPISWYYQPLFAPSKMVLAVDGLT